MGAVYRATQRSLGRAVAVKVLPRDLESEGAVARFEREARILAQLNHPSVVQIYDMGRSRDDHYFIAMEFCSGGSVSGLIRERGSLTEVEAVSILLPAVAALGEAAATGIHHRDLKPDNLLLDGAGRVKVADFGLAHLGDATVQLTQAGAAMGTPAYMPPEQWRDVRTCDLRSDFYALGVLLFLLATGKRPFHGPSYVNYLTQHLEVEPPDPRELTGGRVSEALAAITLKLLAKDPKQRYQTAAELDQALRPLLGEARRLMLFPPNDRPTLKASREALGPGGLRGEGLKGSLASSEPGGGPRVGSLPTAGEEAPPPGTLKADLHAMQTELDSRRSAPRRRSRLLWVVVLLLVGLVVADHVGKRKKRTAWRQEVNQRVTEGDRDGALALLASPPPLVRPAEAASLRRKAEAAGKAPPSNPLARAGTPESGAGPSGADAVVDRKIAEEDPGPVSGAEKEPAPVPRNPLVRSGVPEAPPEAASDPIGTAGSAIGHFVAQNPSVAGVVRRTFGEVAPALSLPDAHRRLARASSTGTAEDAEALEALLEFLDEASEFDELIGEARGANDEQDALDRYDQALLEYPGQGAERRSLARRERDRVAWELARQVAAEAHDLLTSGATQAGRLRMARAFEIAPLAHRAELEEQVKRWRREFKGGR
jgi:serine/threonine-protein kinase